MKRIMFFIILLSFIIPKQFPAIIMTNSEREFICFEYPIPAIKVVKILKNYSNYQMIVTNTMMLTSNINLYFTNTKIIEKQIEVESTLKVNQAKKDYFLIGFGSGSILVIILSIIINN